MAEEGAEATAVHLREAATAFRKGQRDRGVAHLEKAVGEAKTERKPEASKEIGEQVTSIQAGLDSIRAEVLPGESHPVMPGEE